MCLSMSEPCQNVNDPALALYDSIRDAINEKINFLALQKLIYPSTFSGPRTVQIIISYQGFTVNNILHNSSTDEAAFTYISFL